MNIFYALGGGALGIILLVLLLSMVALRRVVPTNRVDIIQSSKWTRSYGKGREFGNVYYAIPSWVPFLGVTVTHFPESVFDITLTGYDAYDAGRLPFHVDVMAFFRVEDSDKAAHRVADFPELLAQLKGVLQGAVRRTLAVHKLEQIMEDRTALGVTFTTEVNEQLMEWGVTTVKSIEFMDIRDAPGSSVIANIMAKEKSRIEKESRISVATNKKEAELQEIDAGRTVEVQRQDAEEQVGIRKATKDKIVGIATQQSEQEVLEQTRTTAEREMAVKQVNNVRTAEIARDVAAVDAEKNKKVTVINAEAARDMAVIDAEANKKKTVTISEGELDAAKNSSEAVRVKGVAEGDAVRAVKLAEIAPQIALVEKIGENADYQDYLVRIEQVHAIRDVGIQQAEALKVADIKVIATGGNVSEGVDGVGTLFTPRSGTQLAGFIAALSQTDEGKAVMARLAPVSEEGKKKNKGNDSAVKQ